MLRSTVLTLLVLGLTHAAPWTPHHTIGGRNVPLPVTQVPALRIPAPHASSHLSSLLHSPLESTPWADLPFGLSSLPLDQTSGASNIQFSEIGASPGLHLANQANFDHQVSQLGANPDFQLSNSGLSVSPLGGSPAVELTQLQGINLQTGQAVNAELAQEAAQANLELRQNVAEANLELSQNAAELSQVQSEALQNAAAELQTAQQGEIAETNLELAQNAADANQEFRQNAAAINQELSQNAADLQRAQVEAMQNAISELQVGQNAEANLELTQNLAEANQEFGQNVASLNEEMAQNVAELQQAQVESAQTVAEVNQEQRLYAAEANIQLAQDAAELALTQGTNSGIRLSQNAAANLQLVQEANLRLSQAAGASSIPCAQGLLRRLDGSCVTPLVNRSLYVYNAPSVRSEVAPPAQIPDPRVDLNYVFVKVPPPVQEQNTVVIPPPQQKTAIYLLQENAQTPQEVIEIPFQPQDPEVFFVNVDQNENVNLPGGIDLQTALANSIDLGQVQGIESRSDTAGSIDLIPDSNVEVIELEAVSEVEQVQAVEEAVAEALVEEVLNTETAADAIEETQVIEEIDNTADAVAEVALIEDEATVDDTVVAVEVETTTDDAPAEVVVEAEISTDDGTVEEAMPETEAVVEVIALAAEPTSDDDAIVDIAAEAVITDDAVEVAGNDAVEIAVETAAVTDDDANEAIVAEGVANDDDGTAQTSSENDQESSSTDIQDDGIELRIGDEGEAGKIVGEQIAADELKTAKADVEIKQEKQTIEKPKVSEVTETKLAAKTPENIQINKTMQPSYIPTGRSLYVADEMPGMNFDELADDLSFNEWTSLRGLDMRPGQRQNSFDFMNFLGFRMPNKIPEPRINKPLRTSTGKTVSLFDFDSDFYTQTPTLRHRAPDKPKADEGYLPVVSRPIFSISNFFTDLADVEISESSSRIGGTDDSEAALDDSDDDAVDIVELQPVEAVEDIEVTANDDDIVVEGREDDDGDVVAVEEIVDGAGDVADDVAVDEADDVAAEKADDGSDDVVVEGADGGADVIAAKGDDEGTDVIAVELADGTVEGAGDGTEDAIEVVEENDDAPVEVEIAIEEPQEEADITEAEVTEIEPGTGRALFNTSPVQVLRGDPAFISLAGEIQELQNEFSNTLTGSNSLLGVGGSTGFGGLSGATVTSLQGTPLVLDDSFSSSASQFLNSNNDLQTTSINAIPAGLLGRTSVRLRPTILSNRFRSGSSDPILRKRPFSSSFSSPVSVSSGITSYGPSFSTGFEAPRISNSFKVQPARAVAATSFVRHGRLGPSVSVPAVSKTLGTSTGHSRLLLDHIESRINPLHPSSSTSFFTGQKKFFLPRSRTKSYLG